MLAKGALPCLCDHARVIMFGRSYRPLGSILGRGRCLGLDAGGNLSTAAVLMDFNRFCW